MKSVFTLKEPSPLPSITLAVPEVLLTGHHAHIESWRREQAELRTRERRPDLAGSGDDA